MRSAKKQTWLEIEGLETRQVPAVLSALRLADIVYVTTDNANNNVELRTSGTNVEVKDWTNGHSFLFASAGLSRVSVTCGSGNDRVVDNVSWLGLTAYGNAGNDYLEGYNAADYLYGGDGNDSLVGYGGDDVMYGGNGNDILKGMAGNDYLYGDAGDDIVVGGDGNDYLVGGDGDDQIIGGAGTNWLYGGNGNDTLVTINGNTTDYADGGAGYDTVWTDQNYIQVLFVQIPVQDTIVNAEKIQAVASFANGADRTLDGDWIASPTDGTNYKSFASHPVFGAGGPSVNDIDQNALGDCWLMASLGSMANDHPNAARSLVADFGDGTYGVALGGKFYRVTGDLPTWSAASSDLKFAGLGHDGSLWVALVEKAYASYRTGANTYASLNNGDPQDALKAYGETSVGEHYYAVGSNSTTLANDVYTHWNAYQSCTICTGTVPNGSPLVGSHCYTVYSVNRDALGRVTSIIVRNPWGPNDTNGNPFVTLTPGQLSACQIWVAFGNATP
jgi:hypothetical protein